MKTKEKKKKQSTKNQYSSFLGGEGIDAVTLEKFFQSASAQKTTNAPSLKELIGVIQTLPPLYESVDLSQEKVESIYALGYQAYEQGRYEDAIKHFRLAYMLDSRNDKYLFSLGLALEKNKDFFQATTAYQFWSSFHPESPFGHFRTGICFLEMEDIASAKSFFQESLSLSKVNNDFSPIYERTLLYISGLEG
ncbi:tetratricopeptide repeat protein [Candidatus Similichlamydia laticola]|uniref:Putative low calcium response protein H n=1 Tax=Candidatus Similichlamydia laticola TaxID=2170265 RepID=A0A369KF39_9BACT|nr:tetratricopeptide repeat protein [Candidatus Similichlamydia laticola]RDB31315.1 putative low calcium response protein H [Candidatus Similichlamydia laticola]